MKNWHKILKFTLLQAVKGSKFVISTIVVGIVVLVAAAVTNIFVSGAFDKGSEVKDLTYVCVINETGLTIDNETFIKKHQEKYPMLQIKELADVTAEKAASNEAFLGETPEKSLVLNISEDEDTCNLTVYIPDMSSISVGDSEDFAEDYSQMVKNAKIKSLGASENEVNMAVSDIRIDQVKAQEADESEENFLLSYMTSMIVIMLIYFLVIFYGQSIGQIVSMEKTSKLMEYMLTLTGPSGIIFGKVTAIFCEAVSQLVIWALCGISGVLISNAFILNLTGKQGKNIMALLAEVLPEGGASHNFALLLVLTVIAMLAAFLFYCFVSALFASFAATAEDLTQTNGLTMMSMLAGFLVSLYVPLFTDNSKIGMIIIRLIPFTAAFSLPGDVISAKIGIVEFLLYLALLLFFTVMLAILTGRVYKNRLFKRGTKGIFGEILSAITGKETSKEEETSEEDKKAKASVNFENYDNAKKTYTIVGFALLALILGANVLGGLVGNVIANMTAVGRHIGLSDVYEDKTFLTIYNIVSMYLVAVPLCTITMKLSNDSISKVKGTISKNQYIRLMFIIFPITYALSYLSINLASAISGGTAENPIINNFLSDKNIPAMIMVSVLAPIFEELVFRKLIIDRTRRYGELVAILYSSLAFGLFHCNLYQVFYAFAIGLILGYVYVKSGNIILPIIMHMIVNTSSSVWSQLAPTSYQYFVYVMIVLGIGSIIYTLIKRDIKLEHVQNEMPSKELSAIAFTNTGTILFCIVCFFLMIYSLFAPMLLK